MTTCRIQTQPHPRRVTYWRVSALFSYFVESQWGAYIRHSRNIKFINVELKTARQMPGKRVFLKDIDGLPSHELTLLRIPRT